MKETLTEAYNPASVYREIHILRHLKHPHIVELLDVVATSTTAGGDDSEQSVVDEETGSSVSLQEQGYPFVDRRLHLVFEHMDTDLKGIFTSDQFMSITHVRHILYQILLGLKYAHSANVIHRDLKPANILVRCADCAIKIADFGMSRVVDSSVIGTSGDHTPTSASASPSAATSGQGGLQPVYGNQRMLTKHVVTRWYRAPEIILAQSYDASIDIWSVGCILAELFGMQKANVSDRAQRLPLFPGRASGFLSAHDPDELTENPRGQLTLIFNVIGTPLHSDLGHLDRYTAADLRALEPIEPTDLSALFPATAHSGLDLLRQLLLFDPKKRITVDEALMHPFLAPVRDPTRETSSLAPLDATIEVVAESREHVYDSISKELYHFRSRES
jgi:mitogen-activated protein kinase 1/3